MFVYTSGEYKSGYRVSCHVSKISRPNIERERGDSRDASFPPSLDTLLIFHPPNPQRQGHRMHSHSLPLSLPSSLHLPLPLSCTRARARARAARSPLLSFPRLLHRSTHARARGHANCTLSLRWCMCTPSTNTAADIDARAYICVRRYTLARTCYGRGGGGGGRASRRSGI
jgi:hypothetical protein